MRKLKRELTANCSGLSHGAAEEGERLMVGPSPLHILVHVMRRAASRQGYKNRERQSNTDHSLRAVHPERMLSLLLL